MAGEKIISDVDNEIPVDDLPVEGIETTVPPPPKQRRGAAVKKGQPTIDDLFSGVPKPKGTENPNATIDDLFSGATKGVQKKNSFEFPSASQLQSRWVKPPESFYGSDAFATDTGPHFQNDILQDWMVQKKAREKGITPEEALRVLQGRGSIKTPADDNRALLKDMGVDDADSFVRKTPAELADWYKNKGKEIDDQENAAVASMADAGGYIASDIFKNKRADLDHIYRTIILPSVADDVDDNAVLTAIEGRRRTQPGIYEHYQEAFTKGPDRRNWFQKLVEEGSPFSIAGLGAMAIRKGTEDAPEGTISEADAADPKKFAEHIRTKDLNYLVSVLGENEVANLEGMGHKAKQLAASNKAIKYADDYDIAAKERQKQLLDINEKRKTAKTAFQKTSLDFEEQAANDKFVNDPNVREFLKHQRDFVNSGLQLSTYLKKYPTVLKREEEKQAVEKEYNERDVVTRWILNSPIPGQPGSYGALGTAWRGLVGGLGKETMKFLNMSKAFLGGKDKSQAYFENSEIDEAFESRYYVPQAQHQDQLVGYKDVPSSLQFMAKRLGMDEDSFSNFGRPVTEFSFGGAMMGATESMGNMIGQAILTKGIGGALEGVAVRLGDAAVVRAALANPTLTKVMTLGPQVRNVAAIMGSSYALTYTQNYQAALEAGLTEGAAERYAGASAIGTGLTELINPDVKYLNKLLGKVGATEIKSLSKTIGNLEIKPGQRVLNFMKEFGSHVSKEVGEELADVVKSHGLDAAYQIDTNGKGIGEDIAKTALVTFLTMIPMGLFGAKGHNHSLNKAALWTAGKDPRAIQDYYLDKMHEAAIDEQNPEKLKKLESEFNNSMRIANTMSQIVEQVPTHNDKGRELTADERMSMAAAMFYKSKLLNEADKVKVEELKIRNEERAAKETETVSAIQSGTSPAYIVNGKNYLKDEFIDFLRSPEYTGHKEQFHLEVHNDPEVEQIRLKAIEGVKTDPQKQAAIEFNEEEQRTKQKEIEAFENKLTTNLSDSEKEETTQLLGAAQRELKLLKANNTQIKKTEANAPAQQNVKYNRTANIQQPAVQITPAEDINNIPTQTAQTPAAQAGATSVQVAPNAPLPWMPKANSQNVNMPNPVGEKVKENFNSAPKAISNNTRTVKLPGQIPGIGRKLKGRVALVPHWAVTPSHNPESFSTSEGFPLLENGQNPNDRNYQLPANQQQVIQHAINYDQRALDNMPTVTPNGVVIDGNDRTMSGQLAVQTERNFSDEEYLDELKNRLGDYGFTIEDYNHIAAAGHPRLVFITEDDVPMRTETFQAFNISKEKAKSVIESAVGVRRRLESPEGKKVMELIMDEIEQALTDPTATIAKLYEKRSALKKIFTALVDGGILQTNEVANYYDVTSNTITENGKDYIETLLLSNIVNEQNLVLLNQPGVKSYRQKLIGAIRNLTAIENLDNKDLRLADTINNAIQLKYDLTQFDGNLSSFVAQQSLPGMAQNVFSGDDVVMYYNLEEPAKDFKEFTRKYLSLANIGGTAQGVMFAEEKTSNRAEVIDRLAQNFTDEQRQAIEQAEAAYRGQQPDSTKKGTEGVQENRGTETTAASKAEPVKRRKAERIPTKPAATEAAATEQPTGEVAEAGTELPTTEQAGDEITERIPEGTTELQSEEEVDEDETDDEVDEGDDAEEIARQEWTNELNKSPFFYGQYGGNASDTFYIKKPGADKVLKEVKFKNWGQGLKNVFKWMDAHGGTNILEKYNTLHAFDEPETDVPEEEPETESDQLDLFSEQDPDQTRTKEIKGGMTLPDGSKGQPLFNFDNPIAQKEVNGVTYRITDEGLENSGKKVYRLYKDKELIGEYFKVDDAKKVIGEKHSAPAQRKSTADKVRNLKINISKLSGGGPQSNVLGLPVGIWNSAMELIASTIEAGGNVADAIKRGLNYIQRNHRGTWDKKGFEEQVMNELGAMGITVNGQDLIVQDVTKEFAPTIGGFYSDMEQTVLDAKRNVAPAKAWSAMIGNSDEAKWTGVKEWLESFPPGKVVTKQEILDFMNDNRIEIVEVVKGSKERDFKTNAEKMEEIRTLMRSGGYEISLDMSGEVEIIRMEDGELVEDPEGELPPEIYAEAQEYHDLNENAAQAVGEVRYPSYQLPGPKTGYKELLVTMPSQYRRFVQSLHKKYGDDWVHKLNEQEQKKKDDYDAVPNRTFFQSTHFDEPNILVHLRMNTRTDTDGNRILFLEEIQSDWAQQGRKKGFITEERKKLDKRIAQLWDEERKAESAVRQIMNLIRDEEGPTSIAEQLEADNKELQAAWDKEKQIRKERMALVDSIRSKGGGVEKLIANAPFVIETTQWTKLGLKVALKEATQQGSDKIAWTNGEQQNARYDLRKQVDRITYEQDGTAASDGAPMYKLTIRDKIKGETHDLGPLRGDELEDKIGKELAEKIINGEGETIVGGLKVLRGLDLKIGGTGMIAFYGSTEQGVSGIVGNVAKSLFKQEPGTTDIKAGTEKYYAPLIAADDGKYEVKKVEDNEVVAAFDTLKAATAYAEDITTDRITTQQSVDVTPELKTEAESGLPLFTDIKGRGKQIADALRKGKIKVTGLQANIAGLPIALYNSAIDTIATALEAGASLAQAINNAIEKHKLRDKKKFNQDEFIKKLEAVTGEKFTEEKPILQATYAKEIIKPESENITEKKSLAKGENAETYQSQEGPIHFRQLSLDFNAPASNVQRQSDQGRPKLPKLKPGEFSLVERQFKETNFFDFTTRTNEVRTVEDVAFIFRSLENQAVEQSFIVYANDKGEYFTQWLGMGGITGVIADAVITLGGINQIEKATKAFFVHNHPSGALKESMEDVNVLNKFKGILKRFNVTVEGIVIDLYGGKYATFDGNESLQHEPAGGKAIADVRVQSFNKVVFASNYNPEKIVFTSDAAEHLSKMRYGVGDKIGLLVLNQANQIMGNFFVNPGKNLVRDILSRVSKYGGKNVITYSNIAADPITTLGAEMNRAKKYLAQANVKMHDHIVVAENDGNLDNYQSLTDEGLLNEPATPIIQNRGKQIADALRKGKIKIDGLQSNIAGIPIALYNAALDTIATAVEAGTSLAQAISDAIDQHRLRDQPTFNQAELLNRLGKMMGETVTLPPQTAQQPQQQQQQPAQQPAPVQQPQQPVQPSTTPQQQAAAVQAIKAPATYNQPGIFGMPTTVYNEAIDMVSNALAQGQGLADALDRAIGFIQRNGGGWLNEFRRVVTESQAGTKPRGRTQVGGQREQMLGFSRRIEQGYNEKGDGPVGDELATEAQGGDQLPEAGINIDRLNAMRAAIGYPPLKKNPIQTRRMLDQATRNALADGYNIDAIMARIFNENYRPNEVEQNVVRMYIASLKARLEDISLQLYKARATNDTAALEQMRALQDDSFKEYDYASQVSALMGSRLGYQLGLMRGNIVNDESYANLLERVQQEANKGEPLTEEQKSRVEDEWAKMKEAHDALLVKMEALQEKNSRLQAELEIERATKKSAGTKKTASASRKKYEDAKAMIKNILNRKKGGQAGATENEDNIASEPSVEFGNSGPVPYIDHETFAELAPHINEMMKALLEDPNGPRTVEGIVQAIKNDLKSDIPQLTDRNVMDMLTGYGMGRIKTKSEIQQQVAALKQEMRLIAKLQDLESGKPRDITERREASDRIKELREKIRAAMKRQDGIGGELPSTTAALDALKSRYASRIRELNRRIDEGDYSETSEKTIELDDEAKMLQREYFKAKYDFEYNKEADRLAQLTKKEKLKHRWDQIKGTIWSLKTTLDLSALLRQGLVLGLTNPRQWLQMARKSGQWLGWLKSAKEAQAGYDDWHDNLINSDFYKDIAEPSGLFIADQKSAEMTAREEAFQTNLLKKVPILGRLMLGSERAYSGGLNVLRLGVFEKGVEQLLKEGYTIESHPEKYQSLANYINHASGRGDLSTLGFKNSSTTLNKVFFSPRFMASRLNTINPVYWAKLEPKQRWRQAFDFATFLGFNLLILGLAHAGGADVEDDPTSADFMKIKIGDTRIDFWAGYQGYVTFASRIISSRMGDRKLAPREKAITGGRFLQGKLAPIPGAVVNLMFGQNVVGEPINVTTGKGAWNLTASLFAPMMIETGVKSFSDNDNLPFATLATALSFLGSNVNTYEAKQTGSGGGEINERQQKRIEFLKSKQRK